MTTLESKLLFQVRDIRNPVIRSKRLHLTPIRKHLITSPKNRITKYVRAEAKFFKKTHIAKRRNYNEHTSH